MYAGFAGAKTCAMQVQRAQGKAFGLAACCNLVAQAAFNIA